MSDYFCPNCGADIGKQKGFTKKHGNWTCTECGQYLTDPDVDIDESNLRFGSVGWYCDGCGAFLNKQRGFSDWKDSWKCKKCGHINLIAASEIYNTKDEYRKSKEEKSNNSPYDSQDDHSYVDQDDYSYSWESETDSYEEDADAIYEDYAETSFDDADIMEDDDSVPVVLTAEEKRERLLKKAKIALILILLLIFSMPAYQGYLAISNIIRTKQIGVGSSYLEGKDYQFVRQTLEENGFKNITTEELFDLSLANEGRTGEVVSVSVGDISSFSAEDKFRNDTRILITFHSLKLSEFPLSPKEAKKLGIDELRLLLKEQGFVNIDEEKIEDIKLGILKREGQVERMSIDGLEEFEAGTMYRPDVEIVIEYHTKKEKN